MTSRCPPDYNLALNMSPDDFQTIAGVDLNADIIFAHKEQATGLLIVPQCNDFTPSHPVADAWLWTDCTTAEANSEVKIVLKESCDTLLSDKERSQLSCVSGLTLDGFITEKNPYSEEGE